MEERNLLSIAYKHITGTLRTSWRTVEGIEKQEIKNSRATLRERALIRRQREKIELELADACRDLLDLLDQHLVSAAEPGEERVFYLKMYVFLFFLTQFSPVFLIYMLVLVAGPAFKGRGIIIGTLLNLLDITSESRLRS
jgi:14-3-3 protein